MSAEETETDYLNKDADGEVDAWVEKDKGWQLLNQWQNYVLASRQSYMMERQQAMGAEYYSRPQDWNSIFEREWAIIEERMNAGIGVDNEVIEIFGEDFFQSKEEMMAELKTIYPNQEIEDEEGNRLVIYSFEDFIMLSNQGIFRDNIFLIDPQRKWRKKVEEVLKQYGYFDIERMIIRGEKYLVVTREQV